MNVFEYDYVRHLLRERSGLALSADKQYLVECRLLPLARREGVETVERLIGLLRRRRGADQLIVDVVEAMTTNETFFFRDKIPFDHFTQVIMPSLLAARAAQRRIRIWCAAASTGQEPYSLAMCLSQMAARLAGWRIEIVATDLSLEVLAKAKSGLYTQFEVQRGLPIHMLVKHFQRVRQLWQISPELRGMVQFQPHNMLDDFSHLGRFDVVFCRNLLLYFDQATKVDVLERLAPCVEPDGFLLLGAAETVMGLTDAFKPLPEHRALYAPNGANVPAHRVPLVPEAGGYDATPDNVHVLDAGRPRL